MSVCEWCNQGEATTTYVVTREERILMCVDCLNLAGNHLYNELMERKCTQ